ncbi:hypothetical protein NUACC26_085920 [Scytonema sp. NUACC26]
MFIGEVFATVAVLSEVSYENKTIKTVLVLDRTNISYELFTVDYINETQIFVNSVCSIEPDEYSVDELIIIYQRYKEVCC